MSLPKLNPVEPPWYGPVCPVVWEGRHREVSPYPDPWRNLHIREPEELTRPVVAGALAERREGMGMRSFDSR